MNLPHYDYLYPIERYDNQKTVWIQEQLEMAREEKALRHVRIMEAELMRRGVSLGIQKQSFWNWLKSFLPLRLW